MYFGGVGSWTNCLTNSSPMPRLAPVMNTNFGVNAIVDEGDGTSEQLYRSRAGLLVVCERYIQRRCSSRI